MDLFLSPVKILITKYFKKLFNLVGNRTSEMKAVRAFFILLGISLVSGIDGIRILGIFPHAALSHFKAFQPILVGLAERGLDFIDFWIIF